MTSKENSFYGWKALLAAALALFCQAGAAVYSFSTFLPALTREMGWQRGEISIAFGLLMMVSTLAAPLVGLFIGKYGPRRAIFIGNILIALALLGLSFQSRLWQFYAAYFVVGLGYGIGGVIPVMTVASNWFDKKASLAMSITAGAGSIGGLVLVPLIQAFVNSAGWRMTYMALFGIMLVFGAIVPGLLVRNRPEELGQVPDGGLSSSDIKHGTPAGTPSAAPVSFTLAEGMKTRAFWLIVIFGCTPLYIFIFLTAHQIAFLTGLGIGSETAALTLAVLSGVSLLGTLGVGFLGLKIKIKKLAVGTSLLILASIVLALFTRSTFTAFVFSILFGIGFGGSIVALASIWPSYFGRDHYPKFMGLSMFFGAISSIGAPVAGFLYDSTKSYTLSLIIAAAVAAGGLILILLVKPPVHPLLKGK
jgi:MFS family permease